MNDQTIDILPTRLNTQNNDHVTKIAQNKSTQQICIIILFYMLQKGYVLYLLMNKNYNKYVAH